MREFNIIKNKKIYIAGQWDGGKFFDKLLKKIQYKKINIFRKKIKLIR